MSCREFLFSCFPVMSLAIRSHRLHAPNLPQSGTYSGRKAIFKHTLDYHQVPHILLELAVRLRNPDINEVSVIDKASQRLPFF